MGLDWRARAGELRTIPNLVSLSRLPLLVGIILLVESVWRYPLFALVVLSDGIDGWLARRLDQKTELGAMLDPALDKLTALVLVAALFPRTDLAWAYLVLFFSRDIFVVSMAPLVPLYDFDTSKIQARLFGKVVTNFQFFAIVAMLVPHPRATEALLWGLAVASALAISDYVVFVVRELTNGKRLTDRTGVVATYAAVFVVFGAVAWLLLGSELREFVAAVV